MIFRGDTEIKEIVRDKLLRIARNKLGIENMFVQVTDERPPLNDGKTISQCIDLTNKPLATLTQHNEVETKLQNNNNNELHVPLSPEPTHVDHRDCNNLSNNKGDSPLH